MRIADIYSKLTLDPGSQAQQRGKVGTNDSSGAQNSQAAQQGAVKVTVSAKARELADAASASDSETAKVGALRAAIQSGSLKIDSAKIAERIADGD